MQNSGDAKIRQLRVFGCLDVCLGQATLVQNIGLSQARGIRPKGAFHASQAALGHSRSPRARARLALSSRSRSPRARVSPPPPLPSHLSLSRLFSPSSSPASKLSRLLSPSSSPSRSPSPPRARLHSFLSSRARARVSLLELAQPTPRLELAQSPRLAWSSRSRLASPGAPVAAAVEVRLCLLLSPSSSPSPVSSPRSSPRSKHWAGRSSAAPPCGHGSRLLCLSRTDLTLRR